jgi:hypothetical protein
MTDDREIQKLARKMARSGVFADVEAIERTLGKVVGDTVDRIGSRGFRRQINRVCVASAQTVRRSA